jgi:ATP-binding cassette, subfamily C, bacterial LapB
MSSKILIVVSLVSNLLALMLPLALIQVYDRIIANQSIGTATFLFLFVALAIALDGFARWARSVFLAHLMLKSELLGMGTSKPNSEFNEDFKQPDIPGNISIYDAPFAILFVGIIAYIGGWLAAIPVVIAAIAGVYVFAQSSAYTSAFDEYLKGTTRLKSNMTAGLSNYEELKSKGGVPALLFGQYQRFSQRAISEEQYQSQSSLLLDATQIAALTTTIGIVGFGAYVALNGGLSIGALAGCTILGGRATNAILALMNGRVRLKIATVQKNSQNANLITEVIERASRPEGIAAGPVDLEFKDLSISDGAAQTSDLTLKVSASSVLSINFDNRTEADLLSEVLVSGRKYSGEFILIDTTGKSHEYDPRYVSYVGPHQKNLGGTILDNLTSFGEIDQSDARNISTKLGLDEAVSRMLHGYGTLLSPSATSKLSSGVQKRLAIASALASRSPVVVLNQPEVGLDKAGIDTLSSFLNEGGGGKIVIILSREPSFQLLADVTRKIEMKTSSHVEAA